MSDGLSKDELKALWDAGVPLDEAWVEYAAFFDHDALRALQTHPNNDKDVLDVKGARYQQLAKGWLPSTWEGRQRKLEITTRNERSMLRSRIYSGELWAIGCRTTANGNDELARVPREMLFTDYHGDRADGSDVHWSKGQLIAGRSSYFDIRVVSAADVTEAVERSKTGGHSVAQEETTQRASETHERRSPGRPTKRDVINAAIERFAQDDPRLTRPRSERFRAYRTYVSQQGYEPYKEAGFSDSTLEKYETEFRRKNK